LTYTYPGSRRGIEEIDLCLESGSFTVLTGRAGAGKTTLLRVLLGHLPRDAGQIRWNGQLATDPASLFVPPRCVYIAQAPPLHFDQSPDGQILTDLSEGNIAPPELLICDDLSAALDVRAERWLWDRIWAHSLLGPGRICGTICLAVSHRRPALRRADQITVLVDWTKGVG
jgi:ABC-type transport system involved in cytochrome bd biosynthesis fused ATPase/permease subunit